MPYRKHPRISRAETLRRLELIRHRLGSESDTALAKEIGISRPVLWYFRTTHGIPVCQRPSVIYELSPEQKPRVYEMLKADRKYLQEVVEETGIHPSALRAYAQKIGWTRRWSRPNGKPRENVGKLTRTRIFALYDSDVGQAEIAKLAGVSRERIRQVIEKSGRRTIRQKQADKRLERLQSKLARQQERLKEREAKKAHSAECERLFLLKADRMWNNNHTIREIAVAYGLKTNSMSWHIFRGRTFHGLFGRRPGHGSNKRSDDQWRKILKEPLYLWRGGVSYKVIAACCGVNPRTLRKWCQIGRDRFGWFRSHP